MTLFLTQRKLNYRLNDELILFIVTALSARKIDLFIEIDNKISYS